MGVEIRIEIDQELRDAAEALTGGNSGYANLNAYVRDLIEIDIDRRRWEFEAVKAELQRAFATPKEEYLLVSAEDVIARGRARRRA